MGFVVFCGFLELISLIEREKEREKGRIVRCNHPLWFSIGTFLVWGKRDLF